MVSSLAVSCVVFACVFGGALVAMLVKRALPEHHLSGESKDVVKLAMGLIATLAALVLGLLVATAKGHYDAQSAIVKEMSTNAQLLNRVLERYGSEANEARSLLKKVIEATVERLWPEGGGKSVNLAPGEARTVGDAMHDQIMALAPQNDGQRALKARALDVAANLAQARFRLFAAQDGSLPVPLLVVLVFWLVILFAGYGLLAPGNATVIVVLLVCALSVSGAIFLLLELAMPFGGIMKISSEPLRDALSQLGR